MSSIASLMALTTELMKPEIKSLHSSILSYLLFIPSPQFILDGGSKIELRLGKNDLEEMLYPIAKLKQLKEKRN